MRPPSHSQSQPQSQAPVSQLRRQSMDSARSYSIGGPSDNSILDRMAYTLDQQDPELGSTSCCSFRNLRRSASVGKKLGQTSNYTSNSNSNSNIHIHPLSSPNNHARRYRQIQDDGARPPPRSNTPSVASETFHVEEEDENNNNNIKQRASLENKSLGSNSNSNTSYTRGSSSSFSEQFAAMDLGTKQQSDHDKRNNQKMSVRRSSSARSTNSKREGPVKPRLPEIPVIDTTQKQQQTLHPGDASHHFPDTVDFGEARFPPANSTNHPPAKAQNKKELEKPRQEPRRRATKQSSLKSIHKISPQTAIPAASTMMTHSHTNTTTGTSTNPHKSRRHSLERKERSASPKKRSVRRKSIQQQQQQQPNPPVRNRVERQMQEQAHLLRMQLQQQQQQHSPPKTHDNDNNTPPDASPLQRIQPQLPEPAKSPIVITAIAPKAHLRANNPSSQQQDGLQPPVTISHSFAETTISQITLDDQFSTSAASHDRHSRQRAHQQQKQRQPKQLTKEDKFVSMSTIDDEEYATTAEHSSGHFSLVEKDEEDVLSAITCSVMSGSVAASKSSLDKNDPFNEIAFYTERRMVDEMDHEVHERTNSKQTITPAIVSPETKPKRKVPKKSKVYIQFSQDSIVDATGSGSDGRMDEDDNSESAVTEQ